jgi:N-acetylglucosaminyl-diphospho-decaprenol L-rhamnosyltransferase
MGSLRGATSPAAVVVDYNVGPVLHGCIRSLMDEGVTEIVVVENGDPGSATSALGELARRVTIITPGENLGFGAGVNRAVAALSGRSGEIIVANPDTEVHDGAIAELCSALVDHPSWAIVGPTVLTTTGERYPSVRRFPSPLIAVGHALLGRIAPDNPFTRRYRSTGERPDGGVDWVSGSFFLIRRRAFERLGGFDEAYFMFAEDMDLCWRAHEAGLGVGVAPVAIVTHVEGVSRAAHPYRMLVAHHRSAFRFAVATTSGPSRVLLPLGAVILGIRLVGSLVAVALLAR